MNDEINYKNNPLHGVGLKDLLIEMVDHYGFEILYAYLNINCFKTKPSIESSVKFLKKTDWAREKVEAFYLYKYKNLPKASPSQRELPPRDRIVPDGHTPGEPAKLSLEDAEHLRKEREKRAAEYDKSGGRRSGYSSRKDGKSFDNRHSGKPSHNRRKDNADRNNDGGAANDIWSQRSTDGVKSSSSKSQSPWDNTSKDSEQSHKSDRSSAPDPWGSWKK